MPKITFLGHACFSLGDEGKETLVFDPFLKENPLAALKAEQVKADYVLVSHAHSDHLGEAYDIAEANGATIISTAEISFFAQGKGLNAHPLNIGGKYNFPFGWVKATLAFHSAGIAGGLFCWRYGAFQRYETYWRTHHTRPGPAPNRRQLHHGHRRRRYSRIICQRTGSHTLPLQRLAPG